MKKVMMTAAIVAMIFATESVTAQSAQAETKATTELNVQDGYKEVKTSALPTEVVTAIAKKHEGAKIQQAFKNDKDEYKLVLQMPNADETKTVYTNAKGEWIKKKK